MSFGQALAQIPWWTIVGLAIPPVVAFLTAQSASPSFQGDLAKLGAALLGVVTQAVNGGLHTFADWKVAFTTAIAAWVVSEVAHRNTYKPKGITAKLQAVGPQLGRPVTAAHGQ